MRDRIVAVPMRVLANERRVVGVTVMSIVVAMGVFVFLPRVDMFVLVLLGDVQVHADRETDRGQRRQ